ncbi:MAG: hypothetical protein F6K03_07190 [Kamptonema sp. SIO4C4]|nr:hypothetical protein [Kamptonema sp. SIO4C4]
MLNQIQLLPGAIAEILASTTETGFLTVSERYGLMAAVLDDTLEEDDRRAVNRILRAIKRGRIQVATV